MTRECETNLIVEYTGVFWRDEVAMTVVGEAHIHVSSCDQNVNHSAEM